MWSQLIREKFINFFVEKGHLKIPSSSLIPKDRSVLFTTAGMQQLKPYFLGEADPQKDFSYSRLTSVQKCFRTSDIDKVGDETHLTFFEMLGNFSIGGHPTSYFKKEAIQFAFEFLTKELGLDPERLWITVFGTSEKFCDEVMRNWMKSGLCTDAEAIRFWQEVGIPRERIFEFGRDENFWGPPGPIGPCGPCSEIHYDLTQKPCKKGTQCGPNCECNRFIEIWNLVFMEYFQDENQNLVELPKKNIDTGMGLERIAMILQKKRNVFETDLFHKIIKRIEELTEKAKRNLRSTRIIADHIKGAVFLITDGVYPSNKEQGYVLRRLIRRAIVHGKLLGIEKSFLKDLAKEVIEIYDQFYPELIQNKNIIDNTLETEENKFRKTLQKGLNQFEKLLKSKKIKEISGKEAFDLFQTFGFPLEIIKEMAEEEGFEVSETEFEKELQKHQEISRAGAQKKFGGVGIESLKTEEEKEKVIKFHTATHLLHAALRKVLGSHVRQEGSDISPERLRFDFSHPRKLTEEEKKKVEDLVNEKIKEGLEVKKEEMSYEKAIKSGALAFFREKYPEKVSVYTIFNPKTGEVFSKEICAGPHVKNTKELGKFKIISEKSSAAGIRRIKAILE